MTKVLQVLTWVFIVATLVIGISGLSGNETAMPYIPASAGIMVALIVLYLVVKSRGKQQQINH